MRTTSAAARARIAAARERQQARAGKPNSALRPREIDRDCALDEDGRRLMAQALTRLGLSARAYHRILKVARTIADLAGARPSPWPTWARPSATGGWTGNRVSRRGRGEDRPQINANDDEPRAHPAGPGRCAVSLIPRSIRTA